MLIFSIGRIFFEIQAVIFSRKKTFKLVNICYFRPDWSCYLLSSAKTHQILPFYKKKPAALPDFSKTENFQTIIKSQLRLRPTIYKLYNGTASFELASLIENDILRPEDDRLQANNKTILWKKRSQNDNYMKYTILKFFFVKGPKIV